MGNMRFPEQANGIPLSPRTQWLLFAPTWMLFPNWRRKVLSAAPVIGSAGYRERWRESITGRVYDLRERAKCTP